MQSQTKYYLTQEDVDTFAGMYLNLRYWPIVLEDLGFNLPLSLLNVDFVLELVKRLPYEIGFEFYTFVSGYYLAVDKSDLSQEGFVLSDDYEAYRS